MATLAGKKAAGAGWGLVMEVHELPQGCWALHRNGVAEL